MLLPWILAAAAVAIVALAWGLSRRLWPQRAVDPPPIVYFDGYCGLCNGSVDFLLRTDRAHVLRFTPLQGDTARQRLGEQPPGDPDSIVVEDGGRVFHRSDAALRIAAHLGGAWRWWGVLRVVPRPVRDVAYDWIARNRYRWFGRKATCRLPTAEERQRFLP